MTNAVRTVASVGVAAVACMAAQAHAATVARENFGALADGTKVEAVVLSNAHGMRVRVLALGAGLQYVAVPDRDGKSENIALGYADAAKYREKPQFFGVTVGRYANRIAGGRFVLDGKTYQLPLNDGENSLHGGPRGLDKVLWTIGEVKQDADTASVQFTYTSPDGEMGYPGTLHLAAIYTLDERNRLSIEYRATTDKPTIVNLTNHAYWNLSGEGSSSVMDERLTIPADSYLPTDKGSIPTGEFKSVAGTAFDFREAKPIGRDIRAAGEPQLVLAKGYDHNWVISREAAKAPRMVARVEDPKSGRVLTLLSAQPGLQFYSGNFLDATTVGTGGHPYRQGDAFVLEPQLFPDTPNQPAFGSARLDPGKEYRHLMVYEFSTTAAPQSR
ncbi:MAG: aldose epimerase family protein [Rudaea sp.]|uniref:aldose epimerase family protein n=1 Tax=Rudaea sp. TaxID=2136325 RepID=UPI0039E60F9C